MPPDPLTVHFTPGPEHFAKPPPPFTAAIPSNSNTLPLALQLQKEPKANPAHP